jgi:hypothetical protein
VSQPSSAAHARREAAPQRPVDDAWRRLYLPGPLRVAVAALTLMLASYLLVAALIITMAGGPGASQWLAAAALLVVSALRFLRVGVWVSGRGLRQVGLFYTITVPWHRVGTVRTAQQPVRWLGLPRTVQGQALVVTRADGTRLRALLTDRSLDFIGRGEAFDLAADAIEAHAAQLR